EPSLQIRAGIDAGGGVPLDEDLVAAAGVVLAAEEVVEADFVECRGGGVGGDVPTDADLGTLCPVHHHRGVPPDIGAVATFDFLVAGEPRLVLRGDGVDIVGGRQGQNADIAFTCAFEQAQDQVAGTLLSATGECLVEGVEPLGGFFSVDVGNV